MRVTQTHLPGVLVVEPARFGDHRGFFSEIYNRKALAAAGITDEFVQDNHSLSVERHTLRGLHFQIPPRPQIKLVRVPRGAVLDVVVDLRQSSPTRGQHFGVVLSAEAWNQLYVPAGFAHGFCSLEPNSEVLYKVTDYYSPEHDRGLLWCDPALGIEWPAAAEAAIVSDKDQKWPRLAELPVDLFA